MCDVVSIIELQAYMDIRRGAQRAHGPVADAEVARVLAADRRARRQARPGRRVGVARLKGALAQALGRFHPARASLTS